MNIFQNLRDVVPDHFKHDLIANIIDSFRLRNLLITNLRTHDKAKGPFCVKRWTMDGGHKIVLDSKSRSLKGGSEVVVLEVTKTYIKGVVPIRFAKIVDLGATFYEKYSQLVLSKSVVENLDTTVDCGSAFQYYVKDDIMSFQLHVACSYKALEQNDLDQTNKLLVCCNVIQSNVNTVKPDKVKDQELGVSFSFPVKVSDESVRGCATTFK